MAFTAKILSWRFRLLKRRPTKGGSRAPQDPPLATPLSEPSIVKLIEKSSEHSIVKFIENQSEHLSKYVFKKISTIDIPKLQSSIAMLIRQIR